MLYSTTGRRQAGPALRHCLLGKQSRWFTPPLRARQKPTKSRQPPQAIAWLCPRLPLARGSSCAGGPTAPQGAGERAGLGPVSVQHGLSPTQNAARARPRSRPGNECAETSLRSPCLDRGTLPNTSSRAARPWLESLHFSSGEAHTEAGPHGRGHIGPRPRAQLCAGRPLRWQKHTGGMQGARCRTRYRNRRML